MYDNLLAPYDIAQWVGAGNINAQTLSISDSDEIKIKYNNGSYWFPAQRILNIQFTTPNDGISHVYSMDMALTVTGPTPPFPWTCPTCGPYGSGYTTPSFTCYFEMDRWGNNIWNTDVISPAYKQVNAYDYYSPYSDYYGYAHVAAPLLTLPPNTMYRLYGNYNDSYVNIVPYDYFDYTSVFSIYCADFFGSPSASGNEMICEMN